MAYAEQGSGSKHARKDECQAFSTYCGISRIPWRGRCQHDVRYFVYVLFWTRYQRLCFSSIFPRFSIPDVNLWIWYALLSTNHRTLLTVYTGCLVNATETLFEHGRPACLNLEPTTDGMHALLFHTIRLLINIICVQD
jgi:hypothetical protein